MMGRDASWQARHYYAQAAWPCNADKAKWSADVWLKYRLLYIEPYPVVPLAWEAWVIDGDDQTFGCKLPQTIRVLCFAYYMHLICQLIFGNFHWFMKFTPSITHASQEALLDRVHYIITYASARHLLTTSPCQYYKAKLPERNNDAPSRMCHIPSCFWHQKLCS